MITSKLRKRIQDLSSEYYARLQFVETKARQLLEFSQGGTHLTFTPHGLSHISAVERNYDWLIPEGDLATFNSSEIFCLLCATFFHDAFMIPRKSGDESEARDQHTQRAHGFLLTQRELIGLSIQEADAISQIIRAHAVYDLSEIPERVVLGNEVVDLQKLGACLSMADISHADSSRAPEIVFKHLDFDESSRFHWRRHMQISGITREEDTILMSALTFSEEGAEAVRDYKRSIEDQLRIVRPYFETVLRPIKRVELMERRLESPLDQTLQFQTNTPAILKLLIEGVYDREDVFIRELAQNSLDSCLLRRAKEERRNIQYRPQVLMTIFYDDQAECRAFRIDDNGIGMDLNDVQDTVLWIGNSISSRDDIVSLLEQTVRKNLIATFGIGLLSCFKASSNIFVRTRKENETPIQFRLTGVSDNVKPEKSADESIGTSIIVEISPEKTDSLDPLASIQYYFRQVGQVDLKYLELEWDLDLAVKSREELFRIATTEASAVKARQYFSGGQDAMGISLLGEDFNGSLWFDREEHVETVIEYEGSVDVLNEGIFVVTEPTTEWFPRFMSFCDGVLNFSSKAISLPAGRDRVIKNELFRARTKELANNSFALVDQVVIGTHVADFKARDFAALILSYMYSSADVISREHLLRRMEDYRVRRYKSGTRISLDDLIKSGVPTVYLEYTKGKWVEALNIVDGKQLFHREDDEVELQAAMLAQDDQMVISTVREDMEASVLEARLIKAYFENSNVEVIDLTETNVLEGKYKSRPVPSSVRKEVGAITKFVEVAGLPNKRGWKVGNEFWVNLANPTMRTVYDALQDDHPTDTKLKLTATLFKIMSYRLDDAVQVIASWLNEDNVRKL